MRGRPSPLARAAYEGVTLIIIAAGLYQVVQLLALGSSALGIGELP
ncbi:hypothetical protein [Phenylobacterium koreense]|uniref:Uncharacterized protein n=1 Tax=Phenylobacterium koreense TaxID=266125 RepID=A0ABV2EJW1_9CAUL